MPVGGTSKTWLDRWIEGKIAIVEIETLFIRKPI